MEQQQQSIAEKALDAYRQAHKHCQVNPLCPFPFKNFWVIGETAEGYILALNKGNGDAFDFRIVRQGRLPRLDQEVFRQKCPTPNPNTEAISRYQEHHSKTHGAITPIDSALNFGDWIAIGTTESGIVLCLEGKFELLTFGQRRAL